MANEQLDEQLAKQYAMKDIGMTEYEAENAIDNFVSMLNDVKFCDECSVQLKDEINCQDEFLDDYCNDCWMKFQKEIKQLEKKAKQLNK